MKKIFLFLIILTFSITSVIFAGNNSTNYVEKLIKTKTSQILAVIKSVKYTEKEKKDKIFKIAEPLFDFNIMSKLTLGKKYWPKLNGNQKKKFLELFKKRIRMVYLDRINISDVTVKYNSPKAKGDKFIYMPAVFNTKGKDYHVLFKFWKSPAGWLVYDLEVEGVSIVRTYRSQFYHILKNGTIDTLLKKLSDTESAQ